MHHYGRTFGQSSTRPEPSKLQTQSYQQQRVNRYSSESLSPLPTPNPSSRRLPPGSSFNFFSVVSKFEALDALSPPCRESRKGATPLQAYITSATPRGRIYTGTQSNFAGIFSPRGESKERGIEAVDGHGSYHTNPNYYAKSSYNKNYIPERQSPDTPGPFYKSSGSRPRKGLPSETPGAIGRKWASPELRMFEERKTHLSSIRDMISYFDGALDAIAHNEATPHPIEAPKTPLAQMQMTNKNTFSLSNTLSSKRNITPRRTHPDTPTDRSPLAIQKKRNLVFGQTTPNPSIQSSSPPKSWSKAASPSMVHKDDLHTDQRGRALERSPARTSKATHPPVSSRMRGGFIERNGMPSPRDQSAGKTFPSREYEASRGTNQRLNNTKIEAPYPQQSFEKRRALSRESEEHKPAAKQSSPKLERTRYEINNSQNKTSPARKQQEPKTKVAMMKSLFERGPSSQDVPKVIDDCLPEPTSIFRRPVPIPAPAEPSPASSNYRSVGYNSVVSPKAVPVSAKVSISKTVFPFKSYMSNDQFCGSKNRAIAGDTTRDFQLPQDSMSTPPQQPNHSLTRPPLQTTNNYTHRPLCQITNSTPKHSLSARDIQDIYNELQEAERVTRAMKRKTFIEKWNFKLPGPPTPPVGVDGAEDFVSLSSTSSSGTDMSGDVMVVKEADCGLREPKPLRITEMKRMMHLCRGRAGVLTAENKAKHKL